MSNIQGMQAEFMIAAQQKLNTLRSVLKERGPNKQAELYMDLIEEEFDELHKWFVIYSNSVREDEKLGALAEVLDGVCDLAVVMMGFCNSLGLPFDQAYNEVHRSNMNKFVPNGDGTYTILKRADGKVIKPANWVKPNIMSILKYRLVVGE